MRKLQERHFLSHTAEHLFSVLFVLIVALTLGTIGKNASIDNRSLLAQTSGSGGTTAGGSFPPVGTMVQVLFSATRDGVQCANNVTKAKYRFNISPEQGGSIVITTPAGPQYIDSSNSTGFDRYFEVGTYSWAGTPRPGYVGANSGTFYVENVCTTSASGIPPPPPPTNNPVPPPSTPTSTATTNTATTPPPPPVAPNPPTLVSVSFAVQPAPTVQCSPSGVPLTPVFLAVTKEFGGDFVISSNSGMSNAPYLWGEHYFANGHYTWTARVKAGYVGEGPMTGVFDLTSKCENQQNTPSTLSSPTSPTTTTNSAQIQNTQSTQNSPPTFISLLASTSSKESLPATFSQANPSLPQLPRPQLSMFIDNKPVTTARTFNKEQVEIRVTTADAVAVDIFTMSGVNPAKLQGNAVKDDLLSRPGIDVWSYMFDMEEFPEGKVKLQARVKHTDKRETQTEPAPLSVSHPVIPKVVTKSTGAEVSPPAPPPSSGPLSTSVHVSEKDKTQILARLSDPSSCTNAEECAIYCRSLPGVNDLCMSFAREPIATGTPAPLSLVEDIPDKVLLKMLSAGTERPRDIPEEIVKPAELKEYCADVANFSVCAGVAIGQDKTIDPGVLAQKRDAIEIARKEERAVFTERSGTRAYYDTDQDGVTDYDEINIYHTDPASNDTDRDGFTDGAELLSRTNPLGGLEVTRGVVGDASTTKTEKSDETVRLHSPLISGVTEPELLAVRSVDVAEVGFSAQGSSTVKKLKLAGTAQPNSFVTIYVFSEPIVVTVKADATGAWTYTLDKELPDGTHQVYSAITDAGGRILAKSEPLPFVKVAAAVSFGSITTTPSVEQPGFFTGPSLYAMIAMLIGILGVALSIIGFIVRQKNDSDTSGLPGI